MEYRNIVKIHRRIFRDLSKMDTQGTQRVKETYTGRYPFKTDREHKIDTAGLLQETQTGGIDQ